MLFLGIKLVEECILTKFNRRKMIKPIYILLFLHQIYQLVKILINKR